MAFSRVFQTRPSNTTLLEVPSVNAVDTRPPELPTGAGFGTILLVGEFENHAVNRPVEIFAASDQLAKLGGFGFSNSTSVHDAPVARKSGGSEKWNGNGFLWLSNIRRNRLIVVRVDNSAGKVKLRRLACLTGGKGPFSASDGDSITFTRDGGTSTATVNGASGVLDASGATYPFSGAGKTLEIVDGKDAPVSISFTSAETTLTQYVAKINAVMAKTVASENSGQLRLTSTTKGGSGFIQASGGNALSDFGLPTAVVKQVNTWTVTATSAGTYTLRVQRNVNGVTTNFDATVVATGSESTTDFRTTLRLAFDTLSVPGVSFLDASGSTFTATGDDNIVFTPSIVAEPTSGDVTVASTTSPTVNAAFGTGNVLDLSSFSRSEASTVIDAVANLSSDVTDEDELRVCNSATPESGTLQATSGTLISILGFDTSTIANAGSGVDGVIPAGTIVRGTNTDWVTMTDVQTGTKGGPWEVGVRPRTDDDTAIADSASTVTTVVSKLFDGFSVTNDAAVTRLTASQLDAAYQTALDASVDTNTVAADADFVCSARTSEAIMGALRENAADSGAAGVRPRKAIIRPPIGTTIATARGSTGVGVGVGRSDRVQYAFPGVVTRINEIALVGTSGGVGFTSDGLIEVGSDSFLASIASVINPEQEASERPSDTNVGLLRFDALEDAYNRDKGGSSLGIDQYKAFQASGITAPRRRGAFGASFVSDVTTVDPSTDAALAPANRRRMADFVIVSMLDISTPYVNKLATPNRRRGYLTTGTAFLLTLRDAGNSEASRISDFSFQDVSSDTERRVGIGSFDLDVEMHPSFKSIVLNVAVGATVTISEST